MNASSTLLAPQRSGRVCAVCVTYHPDAGLPERLAPVLRQVSRLVIVDNGSSATAREMLGEVGQWRHVTLVFCDDNLGSARALNLGVENALRLGCEYALLLDQDTQVNDDIVSVLKRIHQFHPATAAVAIIGASFDDPQTPLATSVEELASTEVEAVIASGSLLWLPAFKDIGPFRDEFFIDFVDNEYCARARRRGYHVVKAQRRLMSHTIGTPRRPGMPATYIPNYSPDRLYYQARNDTVMVRESERYRAGRWFLKSLDRTLRRCRRVLRFESVDRASKVRALMQGWIDGVRGRLGKRPQTR